MELPEQAQHRILEIWNDFSSDLMISKEIYLCFRAFASECEK
jgi:hypothetical protein